MSLKVKLRSMERGPPRSSACPHSSACEELDYSTFLTRNSNSCAMRKYRKKLKESNPDAWKLHMLNEADRQRLFRERLSEEKKIEYNEKSKRRMQKYRERRRERASMENKEPMASPSTTRSTAELNKTKRESWKVAKRRQRFNLNSQKRRRIREKDANYRREKRTKETSHKVNPNFEIELSNFPSATAQRKALSRVRKSLPKGSHKHAIILSHLVHKASPRKREHMRKMGIHQVSQTESSIIQCVKQTCASLSRQKAKRIFTTKLTDHLDRTHGIKLKTYKALGLNKKYVAKYSKFRQLGIDPQFNHKRSDAISKETKQSIQEHYRRIDVSTAMPNKRGLAANAVEGKHVLNKTVESTYRAYVEENPGVKVGKSKFAELRPKNVQVQSKAKLYQCLCELCANIDLKLKTINREVHQSKLTDSCRIRDRYHASDLTLCPSQGQYAHLFCIDRHCKKCSVMNLDIHLSELVTNNESKPVSWQKWAQTTFDDGKKRIGLLAKSGSLSSLVQELQEEMVPFASHLFQARWQQTQFSKLIRNPPSSTIVFVMDFAENFSCITQNEVQSAHWHNIQVTIHPIVSYYNCPDCLQPVREAIDLISDDNVHDANAVNHYVNIAVCHLLHVRGITSDCLIQFTDGCSAQYKSRTPFADLSYAKQDLGIPVVEHHYFGSHHGKNPCDGEGGVLRNAVSRAIHSEPDLVINSAEAFFDFCINRLERGVQDADGCNHSRRSFYLVKKGDVNRQRPERLEVATIPGTRKIHAAVGISPYILNVRRLSCFCDSCLLSQPDEACHNNGYVSEWSIKKMKTKWNAATVNVQLPDVMDAPGVYTVPHFDMDEIYEHLQETEGDDTLPCNISCLQPDSASSTALTISSTLIPHAPSPVKESTCQMTTSEYGIIDDESPISHPVKCSTPVPAEASSGGKVPTQESCITENYAVIGTFLKVLQGVSSYPCVVTIPPTSYAETDNKSVIWVSFLKERQTNKYSIEDKQFVILPPDIVKILAPPDISCCGTRILYSFKDF